MVHSSGLAEEVLNSHNIEKDRNKIERNDIEKTVQKETVLKGKEKQISKGK